MEGVIFDKEMSGK